MSARAAFQIRRLSVAFRFELVSGNGQVLLIGEWEPSVELARQSVTDARWALGLLPVMDRSRPEIVEVSR